MSIPASQLELAIKNTTFTLAQTQPTIRSAYQVIAPAYGVVIAETTIGNTVATFGKFEERDSLAWKQAKSWFAAVCAWHEARETLSGYSQHNANLVLANWTIMPDGNNWTISHPVCGVFTGVTLPIDGSGRPTLLGRLTAIIARVLPPTTWGFAESDSAESLTVHCIQVQGATSYNVYNDMSNGNFVLLGSVPDHTSRTLNVAVGYYQVRIAAVVNGTVGIMSNANQVQVEAADAQPDSQAKSVSFAIPSSAVKTDVPDKPKETWREKLSATWDKLRKTE